MNLAAVVAWLVVACKLIHIVRERRRGRMKSRNRRAVVQGNFGSSGMRHKGNHVAQHHSTQQCAHRDTE